MEMDLYTSEGHLYFFGLKCPYLVKEHSPGLYKLHRTAEPTDVKPSGYILMPTARAAYFTKHLYMPTESVIHRAKIILRVSTLPKDIQFNGGPSCQDVDPAYVQKHLEEFLCHEYQVKVQIPHCPSEPVRISVKENTPSTECATEDSLG